MVINSSSEAKLKRVHPDLIKVVRRTAKLIKDKSSGILERHKENSSANNC